MKFLTQAALWKAIGGMLTIAGGIIIAEYGKKQLSL